MSDLVDEFDERESELGYLVRQPNHVLRVDGVKVLQHIERTGNRDMTMCGKDIWRQTPLRHSIRSAWPLDEALFTHLLDYRSAWPHGGAPFTHHGDYEMEWCTDCREAI